MKKLSTKLIALVMALVTILSCCAVMMTSVAVNAVKKLKIDYATANGISLSWTAVDEADGYRIFRYVLSEKKWKALKTTKALNYVDEDVENAEVYYYVVRAYEYVNAKAVFSKNSNTVKAVLAPAKVTGLTVASRTETSLSIKWNAQPKAAGYLVYVYNPAARKYQQKASVTGASYTLTGLTQGTSYKIAIKAYVKHGAYVYGDFSSVLTATTSGPQVPTELKGVADPYKGQINLSWNGSLQNEGYVVHCYESAEGGWKEIGTTKATSFTVSGIKETSSYTYAVSSYTGSGANKLSSPKSDSVSVYYKSRTDSENEQTQEMAQKGIFGYLYDPNEKCFYTASDPWQRMVGYNAIFDVCAPFTFIDFDTVRLDFPYEGKDWRIQLWKGQYGLLFYGAEVGVYTKPQDRKLAHYNCASDEDLLNMEMIFLQNKNGKWVEKFSRPYGAYWWCTGFVPGNLFGNFDILKLDMRITMKDYTMLSGFTSALTKAGIKYDVIGLDVYFMYE